MLRSKSYFIIERAKIGIDLSRKEHVENNIIQVCWIFKLDVKLALKSPHIFQACLQEKRADNSKLDLVWNFDILILCKMDFRNIMYGEKKQTFILVIKLVSYHVQNFFYLFLYLAWHLVVKITSFNDLFFGK